MSLLRRFLSWPTNLPWPATTKIHLMDAWHDYMLQSIDQATMLMHEACDQQGGTLQWVHHLIAQINMQTGYMAVPRLATIKNSWHNPTQCHPKSIAHPPVPSQPTVNPPHHGQAMPTHTDPPAQWAKYYRNYPHSILQQLIAYPAHPSDKSKGLQHTQLLAVTMWTFSMLDFYKCMVTQHHLCVATTEDLRPVPGPIANIGEINVIRWAVQCGMTCRTLLLITSVACQCCNQDLGCTLGSAEVWPNFPASLEDIPMYVVSSSTTTAASATVELSAVEPTLPQEDVKIISESSAQTEQPAANAPTGGICSKGEDCTHNVQP
ncbi:hypothetical protein C8Q74DRAFT_1220440 [Fomes fomentarius]|nr:hypothetical protein C8Q74DRAFT_1220440 [Fomes fomentarius]